MIREILSAIGIVVVILFFSREIRGWRAGTHIISRKQRRLRSASAILLIGILLMLLIGDSWLGSALMGKIIYWMACFVLTIALLIIALIDIHQVGKTMDEYVRDMVVDLIDPADKGKDADKDGTAP